MPSIRDNAGIKKSIGVRIEVHNSRHNSSFLNVVDLSCGYLKSANDESPLCTEEGRHLIEKSDFRKLKRMINCLII